MWDCSDLEKFVLKKLFLLECFCLNVFESFIIHCAETFTPTRNEQSKMHVTKRDGRVEGVQFDKVTSRIKKLCDGLLYVDPVIIAQKVCSGIYNGVTTSELDELVSETSAQMTTHHPEYGVLAGRVCMSNLHKNTPSNFSDAMRVLSDFVDPVTGEKQSILASHVLKFIEQNQTILDDTIRHERDFTYSYFAVKTLMRSYLHRVSKVVIERPQYMLMRVACGIWCGNLQKILQTYEDLSRKRYTHATPTLFNAGTKTASMSSCFLLDMKGDSVDGIYDTLKQCAQISKHAGGIGVAVSGIRAKGSYIRGTNGFSDGVVPMLRVFNNTARYINQSGKRKGAFAVYLEPWHADVFEFLDLRKPHGSDELRARDLFYGLWVCDIFMDRVREDGDWCLMCPNESPGLQDLWGDAFNTLYEQYEREGMFRRKIKARLVWAAIIESQQETGTPYMLYKDAVNRKSNQQNLGTIKSSNLCVEIVQFTSPEEVACCNLGSLSLPMFVDSCGTYNHAALYDAAYALTENLNQVIDVTYYPVQEAKVSNLRHRPIAVGVQGLADVFIRLRYPYESTAAQELNKDIFETIYFACLTASKDLAKKFGAYDSYQGCPASQGRLQFDLWGVSPHSKRWPWDHLKSEIQLYGLRNSLVTAPMPTASTAQILGNTESFEPLNNNCYVRRTMAGEFIVLNEELVADLNREGLWCPSMMRQIMLHSGSIQMIPEIPEEIRALYKTVWEMKMKTLIDMAADRGVYIDQSQSFNCYMAKPNYSKMTSMHFYAHKKGLKTGMYYLRSQAPSEAVKITVGMKSDASGESVQMNTPKKTEPLLATENALVCSLQTRDECSSCAC